MSSLTSKAKISELIFCQDLPSLRSFKFNFILVYDQVLDQYEELKAWHQDCSFKYAVQGGEGLKAIENFPDHISYLLNLTQGLNPRQLKLVGLGGGSVGDFVGFCAHILKRGVDLIHIPTTWLAAMDSSHGGKTALNVGAVKNQIGAFHFATKIYLVQEILKKQSLEHRQDAYGELVKMALLNGGPWIKSLTKNHNLSFDFFWKLLPHVIGAKNKIVQKDPFEQKGDRQVLNLGHTMGHVFEGLCGWSHGRSVSLGLRFMLEWSFQKKILSKSEYQKARLLFEAGRKDHEDFFKLKNLNEEKIRDFLLKDKKRSSKEDLTFIFLKKIGSPVRQKVSVSQMIEEFKRQISCGWAL